MIKKRMLKQLTLRSFPQLKQRFRSLWFLNYDARKWTMTTSGQNQSLMGV
jgi:hypothetical protein